MTASVEVVVNPAAGAGRAMVVLPSVQEALARARIDFTTRITDRPGDATTIARQASAAGIDAVVGVGGDGLVNELVNGLASTATSLAVVPAGTGNDFARGAGAGVAGRGSTLDLAWLRTVSPAPVDLGRVITGGTERYFANVAGAGFDAAVNETANARVGGLQGAPRYIVALVKTLGRFEPSAFTVMVDGEHIEREAMLVAIANGTTYGGGMRIAPDAVLDDGLLDVCIVHAMTRRAFVANVPRVFTGSHVKDPRITMLRGAAIDIDATGGTLYADGERFGDLPAAITVAPKALSLLRPPR